jgi:alpha-glucosidase (family GH31 glycosyl hydrolase)
VAASAKKAYGLRYRLLTYIYSNLFLAHTRGGAVAKPVMFTDPADVKARYGKEHEATACLRVKDSTL